MCGESARLIVQPTHPPRLAWMPVASNYYNDRDGHNGVRTADNWT